VWEYRLRRRTNLYEAGDRIPPPPPLLTKFSEPPFEVPFRLYWRVSLRIMHMAS